MDHKKAQQVKDRVAKAAGVPVIYVGFVRGTDQGSDEVPQFIDVSIPDGQDRQEIAARLQAVEYPPHQYTVDNDKHDLSILTDLVAPELFN